MKNIDFDNLTDDQLDRLVNGFKTINNSIMAELFKVGQRIKMQPFIDSDKWVYGTIKEIDVGSIVVDWEDKPNEKFRHYKDEYKYFTIEDICEAIDEYAKLKLKDAYLEGFENGWERKEGGVSSFGISEDLADKYVNK